MGSDVVLELAAAGRDRVDAPVADRLVEV